MVPFSCRNYLNIKLSIFAGICFRYSGVKTAGTKSFIDTSATLGDINNRRIFFLVAYVCLMQPGPSKSGRGSRYHLEFAMS